MEFPEPVIELAIEPKTKAGQEKMGDALAKLAEEDPTFRAHTDQETGQTIIAGMGELHLKSSLTVFFVSSKLKLTLVLLRLLTKKHSQKQLIVEGKYAKQSGGKGQYGHCKVKFEPMEANGEGLTSSKTKLLVVLFLRNTSQQLNRYQRSYESWYSCWIPSS